MFIQSTRTIYSYSSPYPFVHIFHIIKYLFTRTIRFPHFPYTTLFLPQFLPTFHESHASYLSHHWADQWVFTLQPELSYVPLPSLPLPSLPSQFLPPPPPLPPPTPVSAYLSLGPCPVSLPPSSWPVHVYTAATAGHPVWPDSADRSPPQSLSWPLAVSVDQVPMLCGASSWTRFWRHNVLYYHDTTSCIIMTFTLPPFTLVYVQVLFH